MINHEYRIASRYNLGLKPQGNFENCNLCGTPGILKEDPWHFLSCNTRKRMEITQRHDEITLALHNTLIDVGALSSREPRDLSATDQLRPDLLTTLAPDQYMIDVCVTNPLCKTHLPRAANKMLGATIHAANNKIEKYRKMAQDRRMYFMPFAVETTGGWGSQAVEFINTIAGWKADSLCIRPGTIMKNLRETIAIAIQRGNAAVVTTGSWMTLNRKKMRNWKRFTSL